MKHSTRLLYRALTLGLVLILTLVWLACSVTAQSGSVDCSKVLLDYYPKPPEAGETIYLNAGVDSRIGNATGYFGRWKLNGEEIGAAIDEWDGCTTILQWEYYCGGSVQHQNLILPGADCSSPLSLRGTGGIIVAAAVVVVALLLSRLFRRPAKPKYVARTAEPAQQYCGGCGKPLVPGDAFCRSCGRPVGK